MFYELNFVEYSELPRCVLTVNKMTVSFVPYITTFSETTAGQPVPSSSSINELGFNITALSQVLMSKEAK